MHCHFPFRNPKFDSCNMLNFVHKLFVCWVRNYSLTVFVNVIINILPKRNYCLVFYISIGMVDKIKLFLCQDFGIRRLEVISIIH